MRGRNIYRLAAFFLGKQYSLCNLPAPVAMNTTRKRALRPHSVFHEDSQHTEVDEEVFNRLITNQSQEDLLRHFLKIYLDVQEATVDFDFSRLRRLTTDELFNNLRTQLEILQHKGGKNIKSDFSCIDIFISDIREMKGLLAVDVTLAISYFDYILDSSTGNFIRGNKHTRVGCYYKLTFVGSPYTSKENNCPNCGSDLGDSQSSECSFCKSVVVNNLHSWVLAKNKITSLFPKNIQMFLQSRKAVDVDDEKFKSVFPSYNKKEFSSMLFSLFRDFQDAWDNENLDKLKEILSESLFDVYEGQHTFIRTSGKKKVKRRLRLQSVALTNIDEGTAVIDALFGACSCSIRLHDNSVESASRGIYNYRLAFIKDDTKWKLDQVNLVNRIRK